MREWSNFPGGFRMKHTCSSAFSWMVAQEVAEGNRLIFQMLGLTRQAGGHPGAQRSLPGVGLDLANGLPVMADEPPGWRPPVRFSYSSNTDHLPFQGSKSLLTQMLLALVSNGIRAAGKEGEVEMKFHAENGRCVISVGTAG